MAIRVKFEVLLQLSETAQEGKELGKTAPWQGTSDLMDDGGTWRQKIAAGAADVEIDLNGLVNGRLIAMKCNKEIIFKKDSAAGEAWTLRPLGTGALDGVFLLTTNAVTKLYVSNAGSLDAEVTFSVAGINS
jgi:hypothetical protein